MAKFAEVHLIISGVVQGVGFRYHAQKTAMSFGITGWVRNLPGGNVEILAEGAVEGLEKFLEWCNQGPPSSQVERVEILDRKEITALKFSEFEVLR